MEIIIAIGLSKQKLINAEQLPRIIIYLTTEKECVISDKSVIEQAITESLNKLEAGQPSVALRRTTILPMSQRIRPKIGKRNGRTQ